MNRKLVIIFLTILTTQASRVIITENGYSDLVVAISPDVPSNQSQLIIGNIQSMIRDASKILFRATRNRAYFKDVNILVPSSWTNVRASRSTWEIYNKAEVRIAPASSTYQDTPYTIQAGGCGDPGDHIHLTPQYVATLNLTNNLATFGPAGKVFVHEWAHLRYGVFDEYGTAGDASHPLFYRPESTDDGSSVVPNVCANQSVKFSTKDVITQGTCKIDPYTGLYDANCTFQLDNSFKPTSSLMSYHAIDSVVEFCDNETIGHNEQAPNKHNVMCNSQSVWSIISNHADFSGIDNQPVNASDFSPPDPVFKIVRSGEGSRYVLVVDTSGSMAGYMISRFYDSARRWIRYDIPDGSELGIVEFNARSTVKANLTLINSVESRLSLMNKVPNYANGATCIGCGLLSALGVLRESGPGGVIVLVSDGEENETPSMRDVVPFIADADVRVVSIAFGRQADEKIEYLSTGTDGKSFFVDENDVSQGLSNAFIGSLIYEPAVRSEDTTVKLFQKQYINDGQSIMGSFAVDFSVGRNTNVRVDYQNQGHILSLSLVSPDNIVYNDLLFDTVAKVAYLNISDAMAGLWRFSLVVSQSTSESAAVMITSKARSSAPITTRCYIPNGAVGVNARLTPVRIVSVVTQGRNPVLGAKVTAYIKEPSGRITEIDLYDNGVFGDTTRNDGIYSRYYVTAPSLGRYSVECEAWDDGSAFINEGFTASAIVVQDPDVPYCCGSDVPVGRIKPTGNFTRVSSCGEFKVIGSAVNIDDNFPPARVTDLQVVSMNADNMTITIRFTAPGSELDEGIVDDYIIRYSPKFSALTEDNFDLGKNSTLINERDLVLGSMVPLPSGGQQILTFAMRGGALLDKTYFIAMRSVDQANTTGPVSNIASVQITEIYSGTTTPASSAFLNFLLVSITLIYM